MSPTESEQPTVGLPAEAMYAALLEEQSGVPFETGKAPISGQSAAATPDSPAPPVQVPANAVLLKGPALKLAQNMEASLAIPTATSFRDIPVRTLEARRADLNAQLAATGQTGKLSFTHLIAWALVQAARAYPMMGNTVVKSGADSHKVTPEHVHLGLAVDVERKDGTRGLMVPVLKRADTFAFTDFLAMYETLVEKARTNKLMPDDFVGATMTLTNPGGLGTVASVPRLMPGQGTIIAIGTIAYPAEFAATDKQVLQQLGIGKVMTMTSTYDHRVIQGAESGSYLRLVDQMLSGEQGFYEEIYRSLKLVPGAGISASVASALPASVPQIERRLATIDQLTQVAAAMSLVKAMRTHGHMAAHLDPLGSPPEGDPALEPGLLGLTPEVMASIPASVLRIDVPGATLAEALPYLERTYCGTIAYEVEHLSAHDQRVWLRQQIESGVHRTPLTAEQKRALLERLTEVEGMERFLNKAYLGAKRFSIEGVDIMVPMLDLAMEVAAEAGVRSMVVGMAHRGRLNVLAHNVTRSYEPILAEFEGGKADTRTDGGTGDVKYHLGATGAVLTSSGRGITVSLLSNPSHLEFVDPVVVGVARAEQTDRTSPATRLDPNAALPVTIHGDAAFSGQGVVPETMNLSNLPGYRVGGTLHLIANNQIGFTTDPSDGRSTRYSSDLAKGFDIPIVHVNADDPEACLAAVRLAMAYRLKYQADVLIDLVGYRRYGHNETDEPTYTQPLMYAEIKALPTVRDRYGRVLLAEGVVAAGEPEAMVQKGYDRLLDVQTRYKTSRATAEPVAEPAAPVMDDGAHVDTTVPAALLTRLNEQLLTWPEGFTVHPKLVRQLERRRTGLLAPGGIEWAHAEVLAFASLLQEGSPVRLTGQDVGRGTFSNRYLVLHDVKNGATFAPVQALEGAQASMEVFNSPLSELATVGFEYGYATTAPEALVIWEAQYGDFVNSAQVILDQFIASSFSKWGISSRMTLLLPHGYEGGGPEHSSGRVERHLQLAAEGNIRVVNCTTPAQYFHLLRRQARWELKRPLVVMTPKKLLRLPAAGSSLADLAEGTFHPVLDDPSSNDRAATARALVLCSGKIYYDLLEEAEKRDADRPPIARLEQLYPFPDPDLRALFQRYPSLTEVVWTQEEPKNMGPWTFIEEHLSPILPPGVYLRYVGRPERASPAEGYNSTHVVEQERIINEALASGSSSARVMKS